MPVRVIGMIGVAPPGGEATVHIIKGGISVPYLRSYAQAHDAAGFDLALVGYTASSAEGFLVAQYAAQADDAQRLALELHALHRPPAAAANHPVHGRDMPRRGEDQAHGVLGDSGVAVAADGRDLYAETGGGIEVDEACGAGAEKDDVLQARALAERGLVEIGRVVDHRVVAGNRLRNVARGDRAHIDGDRNVFGPVYLSPHAIDVRRRVDEKRLGHRLITP